MKFTNGYWLNKKGIIPSYAVEYADHKAAGNDLYVYAPCKHRTDRGDCLNIGILRIQLSSPMEDVIKVSVVHFDGANYKGPFVKVEEKCPDVRIWEEEDKIIYQSGCLKAVVCKKPSAWEIAFEDGDRSLTSTGYRNMAHMRNDAASKSYMVEQLAIDVDEYIYGLGERFTPFVKNGQALDMWNEDGGTSSEISYKNVPFYISNKGYGILVDNEGDVSYEIGSEKVERVQFSVEGERLDYYVINGHTPMGAVEKYTELTGKPALPPAWSFGLWLTTSFTTDYDEETAGSFVRGMEEHDIPLSVFHFDCFWMEAYEWCNFKWNRKIFPEPEKMLARYHEKGLKICVWINPYIAQKSDLFAEAAQQGYLICRQDGSIWQTNMWQAGMAAVDFTNPDAKAWYQGKLKALIDMGVDCFKTDFGERIPVREIAYGQNVDPVKMHNYYTYLYNEAVFELLEREFGRGEAVVFARSATAGSQKFPAHWGGDSSATYPSMAETLRGGLSLSCGGFGFWSHDIGGFEQTASADVYKRWCAFGMLSSHSRLHGASSYRVPWLYDEEACEVLRKFVKLKCALMPYLYAQAVRAHEEGRPLLRPMVLEFPEEPACAALERQYMLGDSLLVAPVMKESGEVEYYLPKGKWVQLLTGEVIEGGRWKKEKHGYDTCPLLVRPNTILAVGNCFDRPDYDFEEGVTFYLSEFEDGAASKIFVPDAKGNKIRLVTAQSKNEQIMVTVEGGSDNWTCRFLTGGAGIQRSENTVLMERRS